MDTRYMDIQGYTRYMDICIWIYGYRYMDIQVIWIYKIYGYIRYMDLLD